jgi:hypothetical protein
MRSTEVAEWRLINWAGSKFMTNDIFRGVLPINPPAKAIRDFGHVNDVCQNVLYHDPRSAQNAIDTLLLICEFPASGLAGRSFNVNSRDI